MNRLATHPGVRLEVDGVPMRRDEMGTLAEVRVQQRLSLPTLCELRFVDPEGSLAEAARLTPGASLRLEVGKAEEEALFTGDVTAVEYVYEPSQGRELRVRGYDLLHRLRKRQPVRAHVQVTLLELACELTADLGVSVEAAEPGPMWRKVIQYRQSDLDLLTEMAERCGLYFTLRGDVLHVISLEGTDETVSLVRGASLLEASIEVNLDPACRSVLAAGWDASRVERHEGRASRARVGRAASMEADPGRVGVPGERTLAHEALEDDPQAEAVAQAELDVRVAREIVFSGVADGDPRLRPGVRVDVRGVATPLAGPHVLTEVDHTIDSRFGYVSRVSSGPPPRRARPWGVVMAPGIVSRVDDPEGLGRVQVTLPTCGDLETEWMGVVSAGAGAGKGLVALPDVGDRVLVLFAREDAAHGVVIGGLYGTQGPPDSGVEGGRVKRYTLVTAGGQRIRLDDDGGAIRLENAEGSYIEMSAGRLALHAASGLEIEAPGGPVVVRGGSIDFERA
ncbi:MAG: phage baseplate assembly protein V [Gemmatimonadetes bacterium]|nr:phage baseplate assembly protein V [Gemmatimonadota bacterium]